MLTALIGFAPLEFRIHLPAGSFKGIKSVSAVRRLKAEMKQLGSDAKVELFSATISR